ncbi:MAG: DUF47 family protein [Thaumarchaeota archaeon]|nr:DUF47 family protein [Nitrososphaerota archaeon]
MSLRNFFGFMTRGEHQILDRVIGMLDISIASATHLLNLIQFLKKYDYDLVNKEYEAIDDLESQTDREHRTLVREICSGSFFGGIREDLLALLELIDNIADSSKGAGQVFHERQIPQQVVDYLFREDVEAFISTCIATTQLLKENIKALEKNKEAVLGLAEKVEESEERADELRIRIIRHLFKNEIDAKSLDIVMLKDFLVTADDIADNSEHGSDVLLILVAKGYS